MTAAPAADGTSAVITWTTNEPATSRVDYGTASDALSSHVEDSTLLTAHSLNLTGLTPGTTYYYRVTSADAVPNTATSPVTPATASFTTPAPDTTAPVIYNVNALVNPDGTVVITWSTDEASSSRVDYGTSAAVWV